MFIDQAKIYVKAGNGGNGCNSFYRDRFLRRGRPDGGDGGGGGDVIMKGHKGMQTLLDFTYNMHFEAESGHHGSSNHKKGKRGKDLTINVPYGTIIKDLSQNLILRDIVDTDEAVIIAKGGRGGKGNSRHREATPGEAGEGKELILELKLIADIGIIGYPNAGKSTLISKISHAKSKIAAYPFTTKSPILGIVERDDNQLVFADMPGLIENAHKGRGLGLTFLRHIERTKLLIHMIDISLVERKDPYKDYLAINKELELYGRNVSRKKKVVALNKIDIKEAKDNIESIKNKIKERVFPISALTGEGVDKLLDYVFNEVPSI